MFILKRCFSLDFLCTPKWIELDNNKKNYKRTLRHFRLLMIKIQYNNMPKGSSKIKFRLKYFMNIFRTWYMFNIKYPWVKYDGFIRIMKQTSFAKRNIAMGYNVQFGPYCNISTDVRFGSNILLAGRVCIIGRKDHSYDSPGVLIWNGARKDDELTIIEDDVWIGHNSTVISGVTIGRGSVVAAGSIVNKSIPSCEIWGGVPAKKIKDRFNSQEEKMIHIEYLNSLKSK